MSGGLGADTYQHADKGGDDVFLGLKSVDVVDLSGLSEVNSATDFRSLTKDTHKGALLVHATGSVLFKGVAESEIQDDQLIF